MYSLLSSQRNFRRTCLGMDSQTFNVVQLGVGFFFIFSAFNSQGSIEETVIGSNTGKGGVENHDGYTSMAIIYAVFTIANFVAAPIVNALNARWAMVFGGITYCLFQIFSSALIGLGAAVIWTAQGKYLALNSTDETAQKNSGVFWAISQACIILGGIFLYIVLKDSDKIDDGTMHILYGVFTVVTLIGIVILGVLRLPATAVSTISTESGIENVVEPQVQAPQLSHMQVIKSTLKLTLTKRMLVMAIVFGYSGIELSFWSAIYPTCIASTKKLHPNPKTLLGLNAIAQGLGQAASGFLFGILGSKTRGLGRDRIVILGALVHLLAFIGIFINFPAIAPLRSTEKIGLIEPRYTSIYAADETPIWLDPTQGKCIDFKGSKDVMVISTGHEKSRITVMLTARSDGQKCLPYVLLPRKRIDPKIEQKFRGKLNLAWARKSWMNDEWTKDYLNKTFGINLFGKRMLVWDAFRCHLSEETKRELKKIKLDTAVVPGGCTKFVQAFSLFKFFQSLLTCAALFYSRTLMLQYHLLILVVGAIIACAAFFLAEIMPNDEDEDEQVPHND